MIFMRQATMNDADDLFAWRNDERTMASSRSTSPIHREDHDRWMKFNVEYGYPQHIVMIADSDYGSLGVVQFDRAPKDDVMTYEAGITLAPKHRGKGLAHGVLNMACRYMQEYTINAQIRTENATSQKLFEGCGFEQIGSDHGFINYRRGPLS